MMQCFASVAGAIAAAVTGTETADTRAAGIRFGPDTRSASGPDTPGVAFRWRLRPWHGGPGLCGTVRARDIRAAFRKLSRDMAQDFRFRGTAFPCVDGPAVRIGAGIRADGDGYASEAYGPDGMSVGVVSIVRRDGRPIRRKGGA